MKKYISLLLLSFIIVSCSEEIVLDDIQNATPRLVVEANINWDKKDDTASKIQTIKLTKSTSYYSQDYPLVSNATITLTNSDNISMGTFIYDATQKLYVANDFSKPVVDEIYTLKIEVDGETYTAQDTYTSIENPNYIKQSLNRDFPGDGVVQIDLNIDNEIGVSNYYFSKLELPSNISILPEYDTRDDKLYSEETGKNNFNFTYFEEDFEKNDELKISIYGISNQYRNYLAKILYAAQGGNNGPFSTAPATIRGNVINKTKEENRAFGFFSMNEFFSVDYTIKEISSEEIITPL